MEVKDFLELQHHIAKVRGFLLLKMKGLFFNYRFLGILQVFQYLKIVCYFIFFRLWAVDSTPTVTYIELAA